MNGVCFFEKLVVFIYNTSKNSTRGTFGLSVFWDTLYPPLLPMSNKVSSNCVIIKLLDVNNNCDTPFNIQI